MKLLPFEQYTNFIQMLTLLFLSNWVWLQAKRTDKEAAVHIFAAGLFCFFLGDLFWTVHLIVKGFAPEVFSPADVAWIGLFVWLFSALHLLCPKDTHRPWWTYALSLMVPANYLVWVFALECDPITNAIWCVAMTMLLWQAACGLSAKDKRLAPLYVCVLIFIILELILFLSGGILYTILDIAVTASMIAMSVALVKGVRCNG